MTVVTGRHLMDWVALFCSVDDFCQQFEPAFAARVLQDGRSRRRRNCRLALSEMMTIVIAFHASHFREFKAYYKHLQRFHHHDFPGLVSYNRFVELMPRLIVPLSCYLRTRYGSATGIAFIDSTPIRVCNNKRIERNRVFAGLAARGRSTVGWFYGFKLHLVVNEVGELLGIQLTPGNVDDRRPVADMTKQLTGKLYGDKGYISQRLFNELFDRGLQLVTTLRSNMKPQLLPIWDKLMLRKRSIIETINDQLKNIAQIEHTRHRSPASFMVNLLSGLVAYTHQPNKPTIKWATSQQNLLQYDNHIPLNA